MTKAHMKRLSAPKSWAILRKAETFITRTHPGAHTHSLSVPLALLLKQAGFAKTTKEAKKILLRKQVLVDGRRVKDHRFSVGLMDIVSFPDIDQHFRLLIDTKGRIMLKQAKDKTTKISTVIGKTILKKGKTQVNLKDGRNILVKDSYKVGDSVVITLPSQKITKHLKFEKGAHILLTGGKHIGHLGTIDTIAGKMITYKNKQGNVLQTLKEYAFVINKDIEGLMKQ